MAPSVQGASPQPSSSKTLRDWIPSIYSKACLHARQMLQAYRGVDVIGEESLVHQAVGQLLACGAKKCESREHALALLIQKMRWVLIDDVRDHVSQRHGGQGRKAGATDAGDESSPTAPPDRPPARDGQPVAEAPDAKPEWDLLDFLALDEALDQLQTVFPRLARVIELRFVLGLTVNEAAAELGVSPATVKADAAAARTWLRARLTDSAGPNRSNP
jgi:DNA-directed RNA polymerase specialized sigma24 family protein